MLQSAAIAPPFDEWPEVRAARLLYDGQKRTLRAFVAQAIACPPGNETRQLAHDIAALLHNISGTAAHFGDAQFGQRAASLEQPVRSAFTAQLLRPYCTQLAAALDAGAHT